MVLFSTLSNFFVFCSKTIVSLSHKNRFIKHYPVAFVAVILLAACHSQDAANNKNSNKDSSGLIKLSAPTPLDKAEWNRLHDACAQWFDSSFGRSPLNGGILVAKNGSIVFEEYIGTAHIPGNDTITANTPMQIASVSKTFTAMAVLKLWQEGKLNIDDELSKYLTTFNYPGVTIRSLLSHRSGLPNYLYFLEELGWDKKQMATNQDIYNLLVNRKAELTNITPPNTHFTYCNTNYALLALLVEKVTGIKFPVFLQQTFFTPLQMQHTFVYQPADSTINTNSGAVPSYDWRGKLIPLDYRDGVYGDKNIYTTPRDLLIWDRALSGNTIFTPQTLEQAYAPYSNEKRGIRNYGLGWRMNVYPDGRKMIYHNGWWHGSNAAFIRLIKEDATIIVIGNKYNRMIYHSKTLRDLFGNYENGEEEEENNDSTKDSANSIHAATKTKAGSNKMQEFFKDKNKVGRHK
ncbi:MAG: beta-lactamase family protein [Bacteroidetes bacterium]|nr:beta-lactamase family protein [Bacteroidota bacterium]